MPKDEYVMPIVDMLVDVMTNNGILIFMDGHSGYNQIYLAEVPFGLKITRATYQRAMNLIFHVIGKNIEVYIDDVVVKSINFTQHLTDLE